MAELMYSRLWDIYSPLFTPTRREIADMYFNLDLTVSEIAEQKGISRQGASECLSSVKKLLDEYESKLGFSRIYKAQSARLSAVQAEAVRWADSFLSANPQFSQEISALKGILGGKAEEAANKTDKVR